MSSARRDSNVIDNERGRRRMSSGKTRLLHLDPALRRFFSYVRPYGWWVAGATFFGLLKFNIPVAFPWILKDVINHILSAPQPRLSQVHWRMAALVVLYLIWTVATFLRSYLADYAGQRIIFDLRSEFYAHLQKLSFSFFEKRQVGSLASRLFGDIAIAQNFVGAAFTNTVMDVSSLLLIAVLLFRMNWQLALIALTVLPLYVVVNQRYKKKIKTFSRMAQEKMEDIAGDVNEKLGGMTIIQSYTLEAQEEREFEQETRDYLRFRMENVWNSAWATSVVGFMTSIAPVLVVWYAAVLVVRRELTVGELTAFYAYLGMFYSPLNRLTEFNILVANSQDAIQRIYEIFLTRPGIQDRPGAREVALKGKVSYSGVGFAYESSETVLDDINLTAPVGSTLALVGPSGAGKSTLVKLLPRFYDVTSGTVSIDGIDIRDLKLHCLRRQIALVPQDPILFSGSILENILLGKPGAGREEAESAARSANAHDFIRRLPRAYMTEIGERGVKLSGGQKQRIALARAFLKDAPVLILDEATSALDSHSERLVQEALERLMHQRTTLVIAHRLSTIQAADQIIVLERGKIVETGPHGELLSLGGLYKRLHDEQFRDSLLR